MDQGVKVRIGQAVVGAGLALAAWMAVLGIASSQRMLAERRIVSLYPPQQMWRELDRAVRDSKSSPLWPNELATLESDGLAEGSLLVATRTSFFAPLRTYPYRIMDVVPGRSFSYRTLPGHPFEGGGTVLIRPDPKGCRMTVTEDYFARRYTLAPLYYNLYFRPQMFRRLVGRLREMERMMPSGSVPATAPAPAPVPAAPRRVIVHTAPPARRTKERP